MTLFYLTVRSDHEDTPPDVRTWLVIADSEAAARSLLPDGAEIDSVHVRGNAPSGPARLIGWMTESPPCPA